MTRRKSKPLNILSTSMRGEAAAFLLVVVITISGLGGYALGSLRPSGQSSTSQSVSGFSLPATLCTNSQFPPTNQTTIDVYQIRPLSVAIICVNYFAQAGAANFSPSYGPYASSGGVGRYTACGFANGTTAFRCPDLNVTSSQYSFVHPANQNVTIAYTIVTGKNITGIYWFFIGSCYAIPLVFGPVPSSVTSLIFFGCVTSSSSPTNSMVTGYWNANVTAVRG